MAVLDAFRSGDGAVHGASRTPGSNRAKAFGLAVRQSPAMQGSCSPSPLTLPVVWVRRPPKLDCATTQRSLARLQSTRCGRGGVWGLMLLWKSERPLAPAGTRGDARSSGRPQPINFAWRFWPAGEFKFFNFCRLPAMCAARRADTLPVATLARWSRPFHARPRGWDK